MAYFKDLSECEYLPCSDNLGFRAVGWLRRGEEYTKGEVASEFFESLLVLLQNPWTPPIVTVGVHGCELCQFCGGRAEFSCHFGEVSRRHYRFSGVGTGIIFVPNGGTLFISPSSIAHYIDAHGYCPPSEFQQAVADCPDMKSSAYLRKLLTTPAREWLQRLRSAQEQAEETE
jgi:hypothetical protein